MVFIFQPTCSQKVGAESVFFTVEVGSRESKKFFNSRSRESGVENFFLQSKSGVGSRKVFFTVEVGSRESKNFFYSRSRESGVEKIFLQSKSGVGSRKFFLQSKSEVDRLPTPKVDSHFRLLN